MKELELRLKRLDQRIKSPDFRISSGKANEVNYYIFDYDPQYELLIREKISHLEEKYKGKEYDFELKVFDLYDVMIDLLTKEGFLDLCDSFEKKKGFHEITKAVNEMLRMEEDNESNEILSHIKENINEHSVVFIKGVGKCFPILRSHKILNNLHQFIDTVPVIMFFPGKYDGGSLFLFSGQNDTGVKDDNYYRAFRFE